MLHQRLHIIVVYASLSLLMTTKAQQTYQRRHRLEINDNVQGKEVERNLNNFHHDQHFLTNRVIQTPVIPLDKHVLGHVDSPDLKPYGRYTWMRHRGELNRIEQKSEKVPFFHLDPTSSRITPKKHWTSRFPIKKTNGIRRGSYGPDDVHRRRMRTHVNEGRDDGPWNGRLHRLQWDLQPSLTQKGQQRMARSSCTNGKVWRRGQCRCRYSSNWDETQSHCVCIYGTYKDSKGNCRPFQ